MSNNNNVFFRLNDEEYFNLNKIKLDYKFKSVADLAKTIVNVFCNLYHQQPAQIEVNEIEEYFKLLENGEITFDFIKPKKGKNKTEEITLLNYSQL